MNEPGKDTILVTGNTNLAFSIAVCMLQAKHSVILCTGDEREAREQINMHIADMQKQMNSKFEKIDLEVINKLEPGIDCYLAIVITNEDVQRKEDMIRQLEKAISPGTIIAINTESISLTALQNFAGNPGRIIGANWVEPAHTTYFLELIANSNNYDGLVDGLQKQAKLSWGKDPYIIKGDNGIRAKILSALVREAFFLVQNGYASIEDIDRACRNDAGYYVPFAGNFRYIDLMGTYVYGLVMKDLNPTLSKDGPLADFFNEIIYQGGLGMENHKGFYEYKEGDVEKWNQLQRKFNYEIYHIISKYPFNYIKENAFGRSNGNGLLNNSLAIPKK